MNHFHDKKTGKFSTLYQEPLGKKIIGIRLPPSMESVVREVAGDDMSKWIRQAIAEKLERETHENCA